MKVTEADIWSRTIHPEIEDLSSAAALEFLRCRLSDADTARVQDLSAKASEGTLSGEEEGELDFYLNVARALEFLKSKARLSLRSQNPSS